MLLAMTNGRANGTPRFVRISLGALIVAVALATWLADSFGIGRKVDVTVLLVMLGFGAAMLGIRIEAWDIFRRGKDEE